MLKTHLQPIVAYFFHPADHAADRQGSQPRNPVQPMINYWAQTAAKQDRLHSPSKVSQALRYLWKQLTTVPTEPQIRLHFHQNQPYWQVYDPLTEQHHTFTSEAAVYRWLEHRYSE